MKTGIFNNADSARPVVFRTALSPGTPRSRGAYQIIALSALHHWYQTLTVNRAQLMVTPPPPAPFLCWAPTPFPHDHWFGQTFLFLDKSTPLWRPVPFYVLGGWGWGWVSIEHQKSNVEGNWTANKQKVPISQKQFPEEWFFQTLQAFSTPQPQADEYNNLSLFNFSSSCRFEKGAYSQIRTCFVLLY